MSRSKRIFIFFAILFFIALTIIAIDMASRTSFPGKDKSDKIEQSN